MARSRSRSASRIAPPATPEQARSLSRTRIISLLGSVIVALSAGSNYAFSSFAPQLQESLHLSSTQINIVGLAGNMGVYVSGPLWGKWVDRRGPRTALMTGALLVLIGYGGLSASHTGSWQVSSTWAAAFLNLLTGLGNCAGFTAAMNAQAKSWGGSRRGSATALVLSGFGLSAFFYSFLSHELFPGNTGNYLLLLSLGSMTSMLVGLALIRIIPPFESLPATDEPQSPMLAQRNGYARASENGGDEELGGSRGSATPNYTRRRSSSDIGARAYVPNAELSISSDDEELDGSHGATEDQDVDQGPSFRRDAERQRLLGNGETVKDGRGHGKGSDASADVTGWRLVGQVDFLLLFSVMTFVSGAGLLLINNVGTITRTLYDYNKAHRQIVPRSDLAALEQAMSAIKSLGTSAALAARDAFGELKLDERAEVQQMQAHQVAIISVGNASGRIIIGLLSDLLVNRLGATRLRVWLLLPVCLLALGSQALAAAPNVITTVHRLLAVSALTGLMYGTLFGLCPVIVFEWFGMKNFSTNWGIVSLSPVVAGNIFNLLFGRVYDAHVPSSPSKHKHDDNGGAHDHQCRLGEECYRTVFVITTACCVVATVLSVVLIARRAGLKRNDAGRALHH